MWLLSWCGLYRVCSPLSCGGFQKLWDGFWSLSVAFKMASHSGSYSRCSEEPGLSATSTICNIKTFIHSQTSSSWSTTRSTTWDPTIFGQSGSWNMLVDWNCRIITWRKSRCGRHLSSERNLVIFGAALFLAWCDKQLVIYFSISSKLWYLHLISGLFNTFHECSR